MAEAGGIIVGQVEALHRYPVKSMLGETQHRLAVGPRGLVGDRIWAVLDEATRKIASAKRPRLWRNLLSCTAASPTEEDFVSVTLPDGMRMRAGDPGLDERLSALLCRDVHLCSEPPTDAELDRSHPEAVLADGLDADVGQDVIKMAAGSPAGTFFDFAPIHLLTSQTLAGLDAVASHGSIEPERYRPNIIIRSNDGREAFPENRWIDRLLQIGPSVCLRIVLATPRCAIPTLAHGILPVRPDALRAPLAVNIVDIPGFGRQPCAGVYASVVTGGTIQTGDHVTLM